MPQKLKFFGSMLSLFFFLTGQAHLSSDFYQMHISLDAEAGSASEAKNEAITTGLTEAYHILLSRLIPPAALTKLMAQEKMDSNQFLINYSLQDEKVSPTRYRAQVDYNFDGRKLRSYFQRHMTPYLEKMIPQLMILPLERSEGTLSFYWPSFSFFQEIEKKFKIFDFLLPLGDLDDEKILTDQSRGALTLSLFQGIMNRYTVHSALIFVFKFSKKTEQEAKKLEEISIYPYGLNEMSSLTYKLTSPDPHYQETLPHYLSNIFQIFQRNWFENHLVDEFSSHTYTYEISIQGLKSFLEKVDILDSLPRVKTVLVRKVTASSFEADIIYFGEKPSLEKEMNAHHIVFFKE